MALYAIVGIKKLKAAGNIQGVIDHAARLRDTANSNGKTNDVLIEPPALDALMADIKACHVRKNSVLCYDVLLTASPEFFLDKTEEQIKDWEEKSLAWAAKKFGRENIRMCICHRDETTPHLSLLITPITPEGKLNARAWTGGREKMRQLWTEYGQAMRPLGLERGREFSPAQHQEVKEYYQAVKKAGQLAATRKVKAEELPAPELMDRMNPRQYAADLINRATACIRKENGALRAALDAERNQRKDITRQVISDRELFAAMQENPSAFKEMQEALTEGRRQYAELTKAVGAFFQRNIPANSVMRKPENLGALADFKELQKDISLALLPEQKQTGRELSR